MNSNELSPQAQLMKLIVGRWISKPIQVVAELGIADLLDDGPEDIEELARLSHTHAPSLYRIMRALASVGIFSEKENRKFELTPMAECLKTGAMKPIARLFHSDWGDETWTHLLDTVNTGQTAFEIAHGMPLSDWLEVHPEAARVFNEANAAKAAASHRAIIDAYDFSGIHTLTDVGGGTGALMMEILRSYPSINGIVADLPSVIQQAQKTIEDHGLENCCEAVECDFFHHIPPGSDAYLMSHVLHDWPDDQCLLILANCHKAMHPGSKLLIVEMIVPPGNEPSVAKLLDLEMLVITGGRERTEVEFEDLLEHSGFRLVRTIPPNENIFIIEAIRREDPFPV
jgi:ubiquinone/menaquinone biosynthesis C-methylase UbiE